MRSTRCSAASSRATSNAMALVGKGVRELRAWDDTGTCRVIHLARLKEAVHVLHAFQKKTRATSKQDIEIAKCRCTELMRGRR